MVDIREDLESKYVCVADVKDAKIKALVVIGEGNHEVVEYNGEKVRRLSLPVQMDRKDKIWRPNKDSIKNIARSFGNDTRSWIGKKINLQVITIKGRDAVLGSPDLSYHTYDDDIV